jgi:hypothetical protein
MRRRWARRDEAGETLIEVLLTIMVVGIGMTALIAGMTIAIVSSDSDRRLGDTEVLTRAYGEAIKNAALHPPSTTLAKAIGAHTAGAVETVTVASTRDFPCIAGSPCTQFGVSIDTEEFTVTAVLGPTTFKAIAGGSEGHAASLTPPVPPTGVAGTGGTLAAGKYQYAVSATDFFGETTATAMGASLAVTGPTGSAAISWSAVTGATSYSVYGRTPGGPYRLIASGITGTTYTDTGAITPGVPAPSSNSTGAHVTLYDPCPSASALGYLAPASPGSSAALLPKGDGNHFVPPIGSNPGSITISSIDFFYSSDDSNGNPVAQPLPTSTPCATFWQSNLTGTTVGCAALNDHLTECDPSLIRVAFTVSSVDVDTRRFATTNTFILLRRGDL